MVIQNRNGLPPRQNLQLQARCTKYGTFNVCSFEETKPDAPGAFNSLNATRLLFDYCCSEARAEGDSQNTATEQTGR